MITFDQIKKFYNPQLHVFSRYLLREYLQFKILEIVFSHPLSRKLSFLGGTCLRIVHGLNRFSEDIDFDNKNLTTEDFKVLSNYIKTELESLGYQVEIRIVNKDAFHCYIKFPEILFTEGLSPLESEKILIQLDTFDQGVDYQTNTFILNNFDVFKQIIVTPKDVILAQKLWTITQRKRLKGRDFFDTIFLFQDTKPNLDFLEAKFGSRDEKDLKNAVLLALKDANWENLAKDVSPFLFKSSDTERIKLFTEFFNQVKLT